jgi:hypothetical protein
MLYYNDLFANVEPSLHPWDKADLAIVNDLICCWIQFAITLLRTFASMFIKEMGLYFSFLEVSLSRFGVSVILAS